MMTARDLQALRLISEGLRVIQVAERMCISERVVERHLLSARRSFGAKTTPEAVSRMLLQKLAEKRPVRQVAPSVSLWHEEET
jgi:DNA-binding CsgD family transcriptional regulator